MDSIAERVPRDAIETLAERAAEEIRRNVGTRRAAFGWSGGKDSVALAEVCRRAGVEECVLVISELEYPAFLRWATDNMPDGLEVVNTGQDLDWLAAHPAMLFPRDATTAAKWFKAVQHTGQARYFHERRIDVLMLGRRRADGNFVGRGGIPAYRDRHGVLRYSPLADWTHEEVLALIVHLALALPPNYSWPRGFRVGTGPWPARQWTRDEAHGWEEVAAIDRDLVRGAAEHGFEGARRALEVS